MITRDILDYNGSKVGTIDFEDGTSEQEIEKVLSKYLKEPDDVDPIEYNISVTVSQRRQWAEEIIEEMKKDNLKEGINALQALWVHHRMRALSVTVSGVPFVIDLLNLVVSGDLEVAYVALGACSPDSMDQPYHWLSSEKIAAYRLKIAKKLGWV